MTEKPVCGIMKIWIYSLRAGQEWKVVSVSEQSSLTQQVCARTPKLVSCAKGVRKWR